MKPTATTRSVVESYLSGLNCPRSLTCWMLFKYEEHAQLVSLDCNPELYLDAQQFRDAYLATKFLSKATFLNTGIKTDIVAKEKFFEAEAKCAETNRRTWNQWETTPIGLEQEFFLFLNKISGILDSFDPEEWFDSCDWGPGVSLFVKKDTSDVNKYSVEQSITEELRNFIEPLFPQGYPHWHPEFRDVLCNKVTTVPKNSKTDRVIAIEPGFNLWFQKGIGSMIRRRLQRVGIDLNNGHTRNQRLAKLSSKTGHLATVDFSMASDTISRNLVERILPPTWYSVCDATRSKLGVINDQTLRYEKFSSMGNGFTFELESLIFYCAAFACVSTSKGNVKDICVYGDDVIIPVQSFDNFKRFSEYLGFTINVNKSYKSGSFRESCGSYFFDGVCCKPFFLKENIRNERDVYKTANGVRRVAYRSNSFGCDKRFLRCWRLLRSSAGINPCLISEEFGDGGFIVNFDEATPSKAKRGIEGYFTKSLVFQQKFRWSDSNGLLLSRYRRRSVEMSFGNDVPQIGRGRYSRKRILIPQWVDLGPWI